MFDLIVVAYGIVKPLVILSTIHMFNKTIKKKYSLFTFVLLVAFNIAMFYVDDVNSVFTHLMNGLIVSAYYFLNFKNASFLGYGQILASVYLPPSFSPIYQGIILAYLFSLPMFDTLIRSGTIYNYYFYFLLVVDIFSHLLVFIIFLLAKLWLKKNNKDQNSSSISIICILATLSAILIVNAKFIEDSLTYRSAYFLSLVSLVMMIMLFYNNQKMVKQEYQAKIEKTKLQLELDKNKLVYKNYENEYERILKLKHDIIATLKNTDEDYLSEIDKMLSSYIHNYSSNTLLNMLLVEKTMIMKNKNVPYEIMLYHHLRFLEEDETIILFGNMIDKILEEDITYFELRTFNQGNNHMIIFEYQGSKEIDIEKLYPDYFCSKLLEKYKWTYHHEISEHHFIYSMNLIYKEQ